jgi:putative DNA primase/helicase
MNAPIKKAGDRLNDLVTEDGAAERFAYLYSGCLRYCHDTGAWFEWNGSVWQQNRTGLAFQWARELARTLAKSEPDKVRYVSSKVSFASGVERFARSDPVFAVTADFWNSDPFLLGTPAGTVDLRTGKLREPSPSDGITKSTAVAPTERADCPKWKAFLLTAMGGDDELIRFLQQFFGYCLTGDIREHALIFGYGGGGNGKSVLLNTVSRIAGTYATVAAMDTFTASPFDKHTTDLAMLHGARLVTASETEEGRRWAEARIKALTGGDPITARFMHKNNFTFEPTFKLFIVGNHKPILSNVDDAARRRFNIVPFLHKPAIPDLELGDKLKAEWPAILRWMIEGCLDWQANGLLRPGSVVDATAEYFSEQDVFRQWLEEECEVEPGNNWKTGTAAELYSSWRTYAERAGENAGSKKAFSGYMQKHDLAPDRTGRRRIYIGVRLKIKPTDRDDHEWEPA